MGAARTTMVPGAGGLPLAVVEGGNRNGPPILFVHGYSQGALCWTRQFTGTLAATFRLVAFDLRGHGLSGRPADAACYRDGDVWADDVAAVIAALELDRPVLVGWSFGGRILGAYVRRHGADGLRGLAFVGARSRSGGPGDGSDAGPATTHLAAMQQDDVGASLAATMDFVRACTSVPLPPGLFTAIVAMNAMTLPATRRAMLGWVVDNDAALAGLRVPALVVHGANDQVLLPSAATRIAAQIPGATLRLYDDCGHAPFLEMPGRFDADLAALALGLPVPAA